MPVADRGDVMILYYTIIVLSAVGSVLIGGSFFIWLIGRKEPRFWNEL